MSHELSAFSIEQFPAVTTLTCHSEERGICGSYFKKETPLALRHSIVVLFSVHRSLLRRDDKVKGCIFAGSLIARSSKLIAHRCSERTSVRRNKS